MTTEFVSDGPLAALVEPVVESSEPVYVTDANAGDVERLIETIENEPEAAELRVLATGEELRKLRRDFLLAARASDLIERGRLSFRTRQPTTNTTTLISPERTLVPVQIEAQTALVRTDGEGFTGEAYETCERNWDEAEEFDLHTPPLSAIRETMSAEFDADTRADFDRVLDTTADARDRSELDEVLATLLVAAKQELLHYDVSKWGEDIGLASKATFSRKKGSLEEMGVVTTSKEIAEMGRPRQRLSLTDTYREKIEENGLSALVNNIVY